MTVSIHDVSVTDAATCLYALKSTAIVGTLSPTNWTVGSSGSGTVYSQAGDTITSASVLLVARAWWTMVGHGLVDGNVVHRQQQCWQTDGAGNVRVKVSFRAGFSGGSPSPTQVPSAVDERVLLGGGTDASPTFEALFPASASWLQGQFSESDDSAWLLSYPVGGGPASALLVFGTLRPQYDGSGYLYDKSPHAWYAGHGSGCALSDDLASEARGPLGLLAATQAGEAWVRLPAALRAVRDAADALQAAVPGHLAQSPSYPSGPVYAQDTLRLSRRSTVSGVSTGAHESGNLNTVGDKGEERTVRWSGKLFTVPTLLDGVDPSTGLTVTGSLLGIGHAVLPWALGLPVRDGA